MEVTHANWEVLGRPLAYKNVQGGERMSLSHLLF